MRWWGPVSAMELRKILAYRSDFWVTFIGQTLIQWLIANALWKAVFESLGVSEMNGYSLPMLTLYYLMVPIGMRILTGENIGFLSREIYDGTFSRYLIYPLSPFQYKTITYLTYSIFYSIQLIIIYTIYQLTYAHTSISMLNLISGVGLFLCAGLAYLSLSMMVELIALWADNIWTLMVMLRFFTTFFGGGLVPLNFFPQWTLEFLQWTPFPYLIGLPVRAIMGTANGGEILQGIVIMITWTMVFQLLVRLIWQRGQKHFTGVGI